MKTKETTKRKVRKCTFCMKVLPKTRYFYHQKCANKREIEDLADQFSGGLTVRR